MKVKFNFLVLLFIISTNLFAQQINYEVFNTSINSKYAEIGVSYLNNNTVLYASSKKTVNDKPFAKNRRKNNREFFLELYKGKITDKGDIIETSKFSKEVYNKFFECDVTFSPDFKTIYFTWNNYYGDVLSKDRNDSKPLYLFRATIDKNYKLSNVTPMPFNSKNYSVRNPEISKDGTKLFFTSDMEGGYGGLDLYVSTIYKNGSVGWPQNLGPVINTKKNEMFPFVDEDHNLYFSSFGHKGKGGLDIFKSEFKDGKYDKPIDLPSPINSKSDDFFFVKNKNSNTGFFTSNRKNGKGDVDIYAFKPKNDSCSQLITGQILNKKTKEILPNATVKLFKDTLLLDSLKLNTEAKFTYNGKCSTQYKIVATQKNYDDKIESIITNTSNGKTVNRILYLKPNPEFVLVRKQKMINTKPIYFDLDKSNITYDAATELNRVITILIKYPNIRLEIKSHTDSRAPDDYNMKLSNKRAKSTLNYIISKGINPNRVFGKGYGETQILNKCKNGVDCTQEEHAFNRRTEFIVHDN
jgi:outer membrane protein OmpA-like peptidoglycan-associated protein